MEPRKVYTMSQALNLMKTFRHILLNFHNYSVNMWIENLDLISLMQLYSLGLHPGAIHKLCFHMLDI
jgi:hypothetical protein